MLNRTQFIIQTLAQKSFCWEASKFIKFLWKSCCFRVHYNLSHLPIRKSFGKQSVWILTFYLFNRICSESLICSKFSTLHLKLMILNSQSPWRNISWLLSRARICYYQISFIQCIIYTQNLWAEDILTFFDFQLTIFTIFSCYWIWLR